MAPYTLKDKTAFQLPSDVSFEKQRLCDAWACVFRHRVLGEFGRVVLQDLDDGRCHISCEVVGDASDPMTAQRAAIFKLLSTRAKVRLSRTLRGFTAVPKRLGNGSRPSPGSVDRLKKGPRR